LGQIVGGRYLYENSQLFDLKEIIESPIAFTDLEALDINDFSQIVGNATIDESAHAVLLDPCDPIHYYRDSDGDGYGDLDDELYLCLQPVGYVDDFADCNDSEISINPGADEICNRIDDNCDGSIDEGVAQTYCMDSDGDGFGDPSTAIQACVLPAGYVSDNSDCNDSNAVVFPGAQEVKNEIDDDCDGQVDEGFSDDPINPAGGSDSGGGGGGGGGCFIYSMKSN
jgi:hypothetical protein